MGTGQRQSETTRDCNLQPTSWILVGLCRPPWFQCVLLCEKSLVSILTKMMRFQQIANSSPGAQIAPGVINAQALVLDANIYKTKMCEHHALDMPLCARMLPARLRAPPSTPLPSRTCRPAPASSSTSPTSARSTTAAAQHVTAFASRRRRR